MTISEEAEWREWRQDQYEDLAESHAELVAALALVLDQVMAAGGPTGFFGLVDLSTIEVADVVITKARALVPEAK